ncbi:SAM-dependent methyltransferase [Natronospira proteinivora]|uniref:SAM-dependent methyltransferase n=1 Tax=Natronospira proteinivora TaxID=1807133 RepID=A0ABT1GAG8_9GAMM|nr:class I SAM-dependent methyltransferase [Natronospira proteinivora]MCP1728266.1 SAM-dependent methyltransferase [Natronospira proteinivora]
MSIPEIPACPLCGQAETRLFCLDFLRQRHYWRCPDCHLSWRDARHHLDAAAERAVYEMHENHPDEPGYRRFLTRVSAPLRERLPQAARGLDFGCGPGPALARMLEEAGHSVALYDPFFHPDTSVLNAEYDFITCTETMEHCAQPGMELARLLGMLKAGGHLAIMTGHLSEDARFARWHYRQDPTHICFFQRRSFDWIARHWNLTTVFHQGDVWIAQKPGRI